jgi:hypothetical protein
LQQKDRCWRQQVDEQNRAGIPRREIAGGDDVADVADAGPDQETCQHQVRREPRLEGAESRVQPSKVDPEIGDPDLELERARLPPDRPRHSCWKDNVAERSHNPINPTGKMKAYRSKRSRTKPRATGRGPPATAIAAPASAATHDSTGTIETTRFLRGPRKLAAHCDAALGGTRACNLDEVSEHPGSAIMFAELMRGGRRA